MRRGPTILALPVLSLLALPVRAQALRPVIDMHLHALAADEQGPPPLPMCTPFDSFSAIARHDKK